MAYNETPMKGNIMAHSMDDIADMTPEEFAENWYNGSIHQAVYAELGVKSQAQIDREAIEL